jgi:RNA polymerase sigma-70 factor, ECF subfamily
VAERTQPRGLPGFDDGIALGQLLDTLPEERREAFVLTQLLGLRYTEAARVSGCPVGTVRSRVARARAALIEDLED